MQAALNGTDPVVFFESQRIYDVGEKFHEGGVPKEEYEIAIGDVDVITKGADVTILSIGATLYRAYDAVKELKEKYGVSAELINLHSLVPLDYTKILESVKKTGKVVLASDACARGKLPGRGGEEYHRACLRLSGCAACSGWRPELDHTALRVRQVFLPAEGVDPGCDQREDYAA